MDRSYEARAARRKSEVAIAWLAAAARDLRAAERLRETEPPLACFCAQQGAEKALNGAAVVAIGNAGRSHSLVRLVRDLAAAGKPAPNEVVRACQILERYYAPTRYPDALGGVDPGDIYTRGDALETFGLAENVVAFARTIAET